MRWGLWLVLAGLACAQDGVRVGQAAPRLDVRDWFNAPTRAGLSLQDLRGKAVVVAFWATWCGRCRRVMPTLDELYRQHEQSGKLDVLAVHISTGGSRAMVEPFVAAQRIPYLVCVDGGATAVSWGVRATPEIFVLSHEGVVLWRGDAVGSAFATAVDDALAAVPDPTAWQEGARAMLGRHVSLEMAAQPLRTLLEQLGKATDIPFAVGNGVDGELQVSLQLERQEFEEGLRAMLAAQGLSLEFGPHALWVVPEE